MTEEVKTTKGDPRSPTVICQERGWEVGTRLAGDEGSGVTVIEITALGADQILARAISHKGESVHRRESSWTLGYRDWTEVKS